LSDRRIQYCADISLTVRFEVEDINELLEHLVKFLEPVKATVREIQIEDDIHPKRELRF